MSVLSNHDLTAAMELRQIVIDEFNADCVRPSSYLLRLSKYLLVRSGPPRVIDSKATDTNSMFNEIQIPETGYRLEPNVLHLARSVERIGLSAGICGDLGLLSCYARLGISLNFGSNQVAATYGEGRSSCVTFEVMNMSPDTVIIYPGVKFCHLRFFRHYSPSTVRYKGIYASGDVILAANFAEKPAK